MLRLRSAQEWNTLTHYAPVCKIFYMGVSSQNRLRLLFFIHNLQYLAKYLYICHPKKVLLFMGSTGFDSKSVSDSKHVER